MRRVLPLLPVVLGFACSKDKTVRGQLDGDFRNWLEDGSVYELATSERGAKIKTTRPDPPQQP